MLLFYSRVTGANHELENRGGCEPYIKLKHLPFFGHKLTFKKFHTSIFGLKKLISVIKLKIFNFLYLQHDIANIAIYAKSKF